MSGRMHSKQSRAWERGSPGRRRPGGEKESPAKNEHFRRRELGSPERSKRSRLESPSRNGMDSRGRMPRRDLESSPRAGRKDVGSPQKSRRSGFDDGLRPSLGERHRAEEEYHLHALRQEGHREGNNPAGLVFLCSSLTLRECFHYRVLGLPAAQRDIVERVVPGTKLFLFNFDTKELFGVFEAASRGGLNLVPEAFQDSKGSYAAQVRFSIFRECLPLADGIARDVLKGNFSQRGKFDCELSADQVLKIIQLFSHTEMRPQHVGGSGWDRDRLGQESKNTALGVHALELDGGRFSSALQRHHLHEKNAFSEAYLMNKPLADGAHPDPAAVLGQGMIEEVDQLALKYLQNDPGFAGVRLDPVNTALLSSSLRNCPQSGFSNPSMDHGQASMPPGAHFSGVNLQPNGVQQGVPFPAAGVGGIWNPRWLGHPGGSVPDSTKKDNAEHPMGDGVKLQGQLLPGSLPSERGLLPIPGMHHQIPLQPAFLHQPGMIYPSPAGAAVPGAFPMAAGPAVGGRPELGSPFLPFHPLQGPHMIPPHVMNHPQLVNPAQLMDHPQVVNHPNNPQGANHPNNLQQAPPKAGNRPKKNKQKKKFRSRKGAGGNVDSKKDSAQIDATEPAAAAEPAS